MEELKQPNNRVLDKVLDFENSEDTTLDNFNKMFNCRLPYNVSDEVEILEPFTAGGRYIKIGDNEPIRFMVDKKPYTKMQMKWNWRAVYYKDKLLGIFKSAREFSALSGMTYENCHTIWTRRGSNSKYLVLELFE